MAVEGNPISQSFLLFLGKVDPAGLRDEPFLLRAGGIFLFNEVRLFLVAVIKCRVNARGSADVDGARSGWCKHRELQGTELQRFRGEVLLC